LPTRAVPRPLSQEARRLFVSIVRIGLSSTKNFAEGYDAIFSKKKSTKSKKPAAAAKGESGKKKKTKKK
jgi:hypothetical protein